MKKIMSYLKELTIITIGVLIALVISNYKENSDARKYGLESMETLRTEIDSNYYELKEIFEGHSSLLDTINTYSKDHLSMYDQIRKVGGLKIATLSNAGLEFYSKNKIDAIDFELMSVLIGMKTLSELIDVKMDKMMDYVISNVFDDSEDSNMMFRMHLQNVMESEWQLLQNYEYFIEKHVDSGGDEK